MDARLTMKDAELALDDAVQAMVKHGGDLRFLDGDATLLALLGDYGRAKEAYRDAAMRYHATMPTEAR
jgi:hypothetical protein